MAAGGRPEDRAAHRGARGGLAQRVPAGLGLAINPDTPSGLPIYPECVPYLARLAMRETAVAADGGPAGGGRAGATGRAGTGLAGGETAGGGSPWGGWCAEAERLPHRAAAGGAAALLARRAPRCVPCRRAARLPCLAV